MNSTKDTKVLHFSSSQNGKNDLLSLARSCYETGNYEDAHDYAGQYLSRHPDDLVAQTINAASAQSDEESEKLFDSYLKAAKKLFDGDEMKQFSGYLGMLEEYGLQLMEAGKYALSAVQFSTILSLDPHDRLQSRYHLASIFAILEKKEHFEELFQRNAEDKDNPFLLFPGAILFYKCSDYEKTEAYIQKLCAISNVWEDAFRNDVFATLTDHMQNYDGEHYRSGSLDEMITVLDTNANLLVSTPGFVDYCINLFVG